MFLKWFIVEIVKSFFEGFFSVYFKNPEFLFYTIILIVLCILSDIYYPKFRGFMGEFWVRNELKKLPKDKYIVLNNIMIKDDNGTHQFDHVVLSNYGIFVIEMKNYYGLIKGKEYDAKWCQYLGKTKNYFVNPIHQNYGHIKTLSTLLNIDEKYFISIICFSNQAKVNVTSKSIVTQLDYLNEKILNCQNFGINLDVNKVASVIVYNNITDNRMRKQHISNIHNKIKAEDDLVNNMICPKCGNKLIKRNGKYGEFIGCSNFPKCRYIKK